MYTREKTRPVKVGNLTLGGNSHIYVQSMGNCKTERVDDVIKQINDAYKYGLELMRLSILDMKDAEAIRDLKKLSPVPLIADIHFDYKLALAVLDNGIDAIRINPGNIGDEKRIEEVLKKAKEKHVPIRIGVNSGSLDQSILKDLKPGENPLAKSCLKHVKICEEYDFHDLVLSVKDSDPLSTIEAYEALANLVPYPLHLGVTEAGPLSVSLIRTASGLTPLLLKGLGNTIRFSLTEDPIEEVKAAYRLLKDLNLSSNWPFFISCPTCGRTQVDLLPLAKKVQAYLEDNHIYKTVAIMGCVVNGPGEAKNADIGLAGGHGVYALFKKGKVIKTIPESEAFNTLIEELKKF